MGGDDAATVARQYFELWNARDFERGTALVADDAEINEIPSETYQGPAGARQEYDKWATGLPDGRVTIRNDISAGDYAVIEATVAGTNTGPFTTPMGEIPATGRSLDLPFCSVIEVTDGKIRTIRHYYDITTMTTQLGLTPEVPAGARA